MAITSAGSGSGLDINGIISQLMNIEKQPLLKMAAKEASYQSKITALGTLKGSLAALQSSVAGLTDITKFSGINAVSSSVEVATISATNKADSGVFTLDVLQTASNLKLTSKSGVFTSGTEQLASLAQLKAENAAYTGGEIQITFGKPDGGTFKPNATKAPLIISLDPGTDGQLSLAEVRDAINAKAGGVSAALISDGPNSVRLAITSSETGEENGFKIDVTKGGTTNLSKLAYNPAVASANFETLTGNEARDAKIKVNGVAIQNASNTIKDVINGVTIDVKKTTLATATDPNSSTPIKLTVRRDATAIGGLLDTFVKSFNEFNKQAVEMTKYTYNSDSKQGTSAVLQGENAVRAAQSMLRGFMGGKYGSDEAVSTMASIGITFQKDGSISLDKSKLDKVVAANPDAVANFFGAYDKTANTVAPSTARSGFAYLMNASLTQMLDSKTGIIDSRIQGLNQSIGDLGKQREVFGTRLQDTEARLRKQYTALDVAIGKMRSTSTALAAQLANLPK